MYSYKNVLLLLNKSGAQTSYQFHSFFIPGKELLTWASKKKDKPLKKFCSFTDYVSPCFYIIISEWGDSEKKKLLGKTIYLKYPKTFIKG